MAYTFGAGAGDLISFSAGNSPGGDQVAELFAGWFYPTTLTAGRGYWSAGNTFGAEVDTTTSEIRLITDNTTDGVWITSGAGITTNKWWFIAALSSETNTGPAADLRVWIGDENTFPVKQTPAVSVSPSGNFTGGTTIYIGNKGTTSASFQGDIGDLFVCRWNANRYFASLGTITADEATRVENRLISTLWRGEPVLDYYFQRERLSGQSIHYVSLQNSVSVFNNLSNTTAALPLAVTVTGATLTQNQAPIKMRRDWVIQPLYIPQSM